MFWKPQNTLAAVDNQKLKLLVPWLPVNETTQDILFGAWLLLFIPSSFLKIHACGRVH